jgi:hypothetical protein
VPRFGRGVTVSCKNRGLSHLHPVASQDNTRDGRRRISKSSIPSEYSPGFRVAGVRNCSADAARPPETHFPSGLPRSRTGLIQRGQPGVSGPGEWAARENFANPPGEPVRWLGATPKDSRPLSACPAGEAVEGALIAGDLLHRAHEAAGVETRVSIASFLATK